jgi:alpha-methylacyl-CoA racemase
MTEGAALLMAVFYGKLGRDWQDERAKNLLDGGAHFYDVYETADSQFVSIGSIEPQFYHLLREKLGLLEDPAFDAQLELKAWLALKDRLVAVFRTKTREE